MARRSNIIRARQPVITRIFPHQGNDKYLIPNRFPRPSPTSSIHKTTSVTMTFAGDVTGTSGAAPNGFSIEIEGVPAAVTSTSQGAAEEITVAHVAGLLGEVSVCFYDGSGDWATVSGVPIPAFQVQGVIS